MVTTNEIYNNISQFLKGAYPDVYTTSTRLYAPKSFPCAQVVEIDSAPDMRYANLSLTDDQRVSTFEVQVFSNKPEGAMLEAIEIIDFITLLFRGQGYVCTMRQPIDNGRDENIKRMVARYTRIIGGGDTIPPRTFPIPL